MVQTQERIAKRLYRKIDPITGSAIHLDPEKMQYLLLLFYLEEDEKTFEIITGRSNVIDYLAMNIEDIDISKSFLLTEEDTLAEYTPLKKFLNDVMVNDLIKDDQIEIIKPILDEIPEASNSVSM